MNKFKPMLAAGFDGSLEELYTKLSYPCLVSPKLDGIRCLVKGGEILSRSLKQIPNQFIREKLKAHGAALEGMDGELIVGKTFQDTTSAVMSREGQPRFHYMVFDNYLEPEQVYADRIRVYTEACRAMRSVFVRPIPVLLCGNAAQVEAAVQQFLEEGYEGAIARSPEGAYKFGRATIKEGWMTKIKPMVDEEATIVGFEEQQKNLNEKTLNELGQMKRSSHKANKVGKLTLGALILHNDKFGEFRCGTGFDDALRKELWDNKAKYFGKTVTFRYQAIGVKDKPRILSFKGFRHQHDL